ncbi:electron transport complex subunit RsxC [Candidatus Venteria ishoeyi]|uniref:electron transport complex subunit RsxC n=1 Tax=Candidatus Venteria ishoeyi TaxID=1899563 RepID=UPI0025A4E3EF|nr:electron transport complex subunit RsxC [Candidatus Venteria ishoeyi]MDM8545617.1 electron transport complex subunit RsxC [Candidatus Venteria ishoeyi]
MSHHLPPLWKFHGGVHLEKCANLTHTQIVPAALPEKLTVPLSQHLGEPATPIVQVGDKVLKGQVIAQCLECSEDTVTARIHAPTSGVITGIAALPVPHPSALSAPCIIIEPDGKEQWITLNPVKTCVNLTSEELRRTIAQSGIVGLGGAGFPSHLKINPGDIQTLILNGAECEPYITCDDCLMRERAEQVVIGTRILAHALGGVKRCIIAIEDNKPEAIAAIKAVLDSDDGKYQISTEQLDVISVPARYPMGGERQLIRVLTGHALPRSNLPRDFGIVVHNVGTAAAIYQAVKIGKPLISRVVTITGDGVNTRQNMEVLLGTPMSDLLAQCDVKTDVSGLIMGGPMMGLALPSASLPIIKTTNCLIASAQTAIDTVTPAMPCIRCGACEQVCPAELLPQQLYWYAKANDFDKVQRYNLFECIECGCCAYVCPSQIPLVQYYRYAKAAVRTRDAEKLQAERARERFEFRSFRLEREKAERKARHQQKRNALKKPVAGAKNVVTDKQAAIAAAQARVKAKKAAKPDKTDD